MKIRLAFIGLLSLAALVRAAEVSLEDGWKNQPVEARLRAYWWWLNGNVTTNAITKDLEGMKAQGMGGALIFDANGAEQQGNSPVPAGPLFGSAEWRALFMHTLREADRLGLKMALNIQSGWNLGGPTVTPDLATKHLVFSSVRTSGPAHFEETIPQPKTKEEWYRDIAVVAIPAGGSATTISASSEQKGHSADDAFDGDRETFWVSLGSEEGRGPTEKKPEWLQIDFGREVGVGGVVIQGRPGYGPKACSLAVQGAGRRFAEVAKMPAMSDAEATAKFVTTTGRVFRLNITGSYDPKFPESPRNVQIIRLGFLGGDGKDLAVQRGAKPIRQFRIKAGYDEFGGSAPDCAVLLDDEPAASGEYAVQPGDVRHLAQALNDNEKLVWDVPAGDWEIIRFGYTPSAAHVSTSSGEWRGRVIDYLSETAIEWYWKSIVAPMLDEAAPFCGKTLTHIQTDSWELGGVNWTDDFAEQFHTLRGYDIAPWLPVLAGRLVGNRELSNRFLADFRKSIGDMVAERHYGTMAKLAHERGLAMQPESGGPHGAPLDGIKCMGRCDMPMSEFWVPSPHRPKHENRFFVKQASSTAHIYGRNIVCAEGFTSIGPHWNDILWSSQKPSFDHEACAGLNLVFWHAFTCSPEEMGMPGQEYFAGTHFNPQVTWWKFAHSFVGYLDRCQFMLQQGRPVADVLHYYGDWVPNFARRKQDDPARVLPGYDYDVINEEAFLSRLSFKDGRFILPDGVSYRALHLVRRENISLPVLNKIRDFLRDGAIVIASKPLRTTGLTDWPQCDETLRSITDQVWGSEGVPTWKGLKNPPPESDATFTREVLAAAGVLPDIEFLNPAPDTCYDGVHRATDDADIYFVCNQTNTAQRIDIAFRVTGKQPELWDPVSGTTRDAAAFREESGRTIVPVKFAPYGSMFVVFRKAAGKAAGKDNFADLAPVRQIDGDWQVAFDPKWGAPAKATFAKLASWTENADEGIRNYSGAATYRKSFEVDSEIARRKSQILLDLGDVMNMAKVKLNGKDLGIVWAPPFRVDASGAIKEGKNELEIEVINTWFNRVWYEQMKNPAVKLTKTNIRIKPNQQPLPSGLLGPVQLLAPAGD